MKKIIGSILSFGLSLTITAGVMPLPVMAGSWETYLDSENLRAYYDALPESDRKEISAKMSGQSFSDAAAFLESYESAYNSVVALAPSGDYNEIIDEDFEAGIGSVWTKNGSPEAEEYESLSFDGADTQAYVIYGGAFGKSNTWIEKNFGERDAVKVSLYFYETLYEASKSAFGIRIADNFTLGVYGSASEYSIHNGSSWRGTGIERTEGWHRVIFDAKGTELKAYIDGQEIYSGTQSISCLKIGNLWSNKGGDEYAVDRVSVIGTKELTWEEKFNSAPVTADVVKTLLSSDELTLFEKLPQCDKDDIAARMEKGKPYTSKDNVFKSYRSALSAVTMYDESKYGLVFHEGFKNGVSPEWESDKKPAINQFIDIKVDNLDISGEEQNAAGFWGSGISANNGDGVVTGAFQNIKRAVPENSTVVAYFYDAMNSDVPFISFQINDACAVGLYSYDQYVYTTDGGGTWKGFNVTRSKGWHKIVLDGTSTPGKVTAYFDGNKLFTESRTTEYIAIGDFYGSLSYDWFAVDNITVYRKFVPQADNVKITDNNTHISVSYDYSHTGSVAEGTSRYKWYKQNDAGEYEEIAGAEGKDYYFAMPEDSGKSFKAAVIPVDKNGTEGDEVMSDAFTESYMTSIMPDVKSVKIEGNNVVGSTLKALYTADNAGGSGAGEDKYRWYVSEDGESWSIISGAEKSTYTISVDEIRAYIKCEVSVAGKDGTYSYWKESENTISDNSSIVEAVKAVQAVKETGRNSIMLKLLGKCDSNFSSYSVEIQQKIAIAAITANISSENDYNKLVKGVIDGSINVSIGELDFADKPIISMGDGGGALSSITFTDIDSVTWARTAILNLCSKGIIEGYSATVFAPNDNITRAQFITLLVKAFYSVNSSASHSFTDIEPGAWYEHYIATAVENGLAQGRSDGSFGPDETITREEMAIFCSRVLESGKCYVEDVNEYSGFDDENDISEYAHDSIVTVFKKDIMNGVGDNQFRPQGLSTRAMAAQVIYIMLGRPADGEALSTDDIVIEDFENGMSWIFENGYPDKSDVEKLMSGTTAYSGTGSVVFRGKAAATVAAGDNRYFRIMFYDANGETGGVDGCLIVEGDKETYTIGANTGKGAYNQGLYYQCRVGDTWYETGVIKSIGWHEFAIDMSQNGKVDMYMDGMLVKSFEDEGTIPQRVVIGNLNDGTSGKYNCYGDDFIMSKSKAVFDVYMNENRPTGNVLIGSNPVDISGLADGIQNKAQLLNSLAILPISEGGGAEPSRSVTRAELAYLLSGMQNESAYHRTALKKNFNDVSADSLFAGYAADAVEKGLMKAENESFAPEKAAECIDALYAAVKLLGYSAALETKGKDGIISTAVTIGLTDGVPFDGELTWENAIRLCSNMLEAKIMEFEFNKNRPEFSPTDILYMNYKFDLYKIKDTVNSIYGGDLNGNSELKYDEMLIGNYKLKTNGKPVSEYLGMEVKAYVHGNKDTDDYTLLCIMDSGKSKKTEVSGRDIVSCKNNQLKYLTAGNKQKTVKLSPELKVIKNGSYLFDYSDSDFMFDIGNVRLIDSDSDGIYDCAVIVKYDAVKVIGYDPSSKLLSDEYTGTRYNLYDVDIITKDFTGRSYPESLTVGAVALIAVSDDGKHADIIEATDTVQGIITSVSDDTIYIGGEEYKLSKAFAKYVKDKDNGLLDSGSEAVFRVDAFGDVVGIKTQTSSGSVYAYVTKVWADDSGDTVSLKMYTDKGVFIKVACDTKIVLNGSAASPQSLLGMTPQLVKYKLKDGNTLKRIDFADESHKRTLTLSGDNELKGSDKFWMYYSGDIKYWDWYQFGSVIDPTNDPIFMVIAPDGYENDEKKYRLSGMGKEFGNDKFYNITAYDANEYNQVSIILYKPAVSETDKPDNPKDITQTRVFVVDRILEQVNDEGDVVQVINGWEEGQKVSYEVAEGIDMNEVKRSMGYETDWKFGDCLIIGYDRDGKVNGAWESEKTVNAGSDDEAQQRLYVYSEGESEYCDFKPVLNYPDFYIPEYTAFWFGKILKSEKGLVIRGKDGAEFQSQRAWFNTIVVNRNEKTVVKGSSADLIPGRECYCFAYHGKPYELIVFVD